MAIRRNPEQYPKRKPSEMDPVYVDSVMEGEQGECVSPCEGDFSEKIGKELEQMFEPNAPDGGLKDPREMDLDAQPVSRPVKEKLSERKEPDRECWDVSKMTLTCPGDGVRRVYMYRHPVTKEQLFSVYEDAARQAGNGVCEPIWVWYLNGEYKRPLNADEIHVNLP